jgi:hypothetical protein
MFVLFSDLYGLFYRNSVQFFHNVYKSMHMKASFAATQLKQALAIIQVSNYVYIRGVIKKFLVSCKKIKMQLLGK